MTEEAVVDEVEAVVEVEDEVDSVAVTEVDVVVAEVVSVVVIGEDEVVVVVDLVEIEDEVLLEVSLTFFISHQYLRANDVRTRCS